jgi:hypothetical protein
VFLVPASQLSDATHLHTLSDAITAAGTGGMVTIEAGTSTDFSLIPPPVITQNGLTIRGDPSLPAAILTRYDLEVKAIGVTLANLNLRSIVIDTEGSLTVVRNCLVGEIQESGNHDTFSQNVVTGVSLFLTGCHSDLIANNIFSSAGGRILSLDFATDIRVTQNRLFGGNINGNTGIAVDNSGTSDQPIIIDGNTISLLPGSPGIQNIGINVLQNNNGLFVSFVEIRNNVITTSGTGTGLFLRASIGDVDHFNALVEGNDFHGNAVGVACTGDGTFNGNVDMGGGTLSSLGGNDFRGFAAPANISHAAITFANTTLGNAVAAHNIFASGVSPPSLVVGGTGILVDQSLNNGRAFVQTLYNELLGRTGTLAELDPWVNLLNTQGQEAVANGIGKSPEALGRVVDQLYLRFLGRQSDAGGRNGWISFLTGGGTLEAVEQLFLTSPEYVSHISTDYVQSLYLNILGRPGSPDELAVWNNNIQNVGGLPGIARAFVASPENRLNSLRLDFQTFLHRTPANAEILPLANSSRDLLALERMVLSSPEFFANG